MSIPTTNAPAHDILVGMGQVSAGQAPQRMKAILGSCIALAFYHPTTRIGAMAHIVLPEAAGRDGGPGKFADTAVAHMLKLLASHGAPARGLVAKFAGGANMFGGNGPLQIGQANAEAVSKAVRIAGVRVAGQDVGGPQGRRVEFDFETGQMTVQCAGQPIRTL